MKMEVLPVQNQFSRQFGVIRSSKVQGKLKFIIAFIIIILLKIKIKVSL